MLLRVSLKISRMIMSRLLAVYLMVRIYFYAVDMVFLLRLVLLFHNQAAGVNLGIGAETGAGSGIDLGSGNQEN